MFEMDCSLRCFREVLCFSAFGNVARCAPYRALSSLQNEFKKNGNAIRYFEVIFFKAHFGYEAKLKKKENT
jgi:hypothetical protein